jgi:hypothetical protein
MALYSGYTPELGTHINDSKLCAGCHSLVTETVDNSGNFNGNLFVEQATWHEWLNSSYAQNGTTCQSCHLPSAGKQSVVLAAGYDTPARSPFGLHLLTGGNTTMLQIMRDNKDALGISASDAAFDATIASTTTNLTQQSVQTQIIETMRTADTVYIDVLLRNLTGHKLPSGYPSRRVSVHLTCEDANGSVVFQSGGFDNIGQINGENTPYEPHHQKITSADQVQIYEMVMGDADGQKTNVLNRGAMHLKDNRLVPLGFGYQGAIYDTTEVVLGLVDADFNHNPNAGSGTDIIHYAIPTSGQTEAWTTTVEVYYQAIPPHWTSSLFETSTPEIEAFEGMLQTADMSPALMKSISADIPAYVGIQERTDVPVSCTVRGRTLVLYAAGKGSYALYSSGGQMISKGTLWPENPSTLTLVSAGEYIIVCTMENGRKQVIRQVVM